MFVKRIIKDEGQADLIVTDGYYEIMCCCWEFNPSQKYNQKVKEILSLFAIDIMRTNEHCYIVKKIESDHYAYFLQGKVLDTSKPVVAIGGLTIELDMPLPKDIKEGEFIEFKVGRLDCYI